MGTGEERSELIGFLDWFRAVAEGKIADLATVEATRVSTPTGLTLLGLIKHLAWAEELWFGHYVFGGPPPEQENAESFHVQPSDTLEGVLDRYRATCGRSREIVAPMSLDARTATAHALWGHPTLRWVVVHMIEETARHAGHLDILRELTDGRTGD